MSAVFTVLFFCVLRLADSRVGDNSYHGDDHVSLFFSGKEDIHLLRFCHIDICKDNT